LALYAILLLKRIPPYVNSDFWTNEAITNYESAP